MSTYYELRCDECIQQGGFFSRQFWGWGNADIIENHKFLAQHAACGTIRIICEHDDGYSDPAAEKAWNDTLADPNSIAHSAWPHGEWVDVHEQLDGNPHGWQRAWNAQASPSDYHYQIPEPEPKP